MLNKILLISLLSILCLGFVLNAAARTGNTRDDLVINGHDLKKTVDCNGRSVVVDANDSVITLRGECNELKVDGSSNTITVDSVASIVLNSADNTIRWKKAAKGDKPKVVDRSTGNKVSQVK